MPAFPRLIGVRVSLEMHAAFHDAARRRGETASTLLRNAIQAAVRTAANSNGEEPRRAGGVSDRRERRCG
jgi:hypothetical protein